MLSMKYLFLLSISIVTSLSFGNDDPKKTVIDLLRETPTTVYGDFSLKKPMKIYEGSRGPLTAIVNVNSNEGIGFSFSEEHLSIQTDKGLSLKIGNVDVKIKRIDFNESTGKFEVKTESPWKLNPMGYKIWGGGEATMNDMIGSKLDHFFKPKMIAVFGELKKLRASNNLKDMKLIMKAITKVISNESKIPNKLLELPELTGSANMEFYVPKDRKLKFGDWNAELMSRDSVRLGLKFDMDLKRKFTVNGISVASNKGITLYGKTGFPELKSLIFKSFDADKNSSNFEYELGAEEALLVFQLIGRAVAANGNVQQAMVDCDPVTLTPVRQRINKAFKLQLSKMVDLHEEELLKAGASPEIMSHLK
jgi:hypothetical protein